MFDTSDNTLHFLLEGDALLAMAASDQKDAAPDYVTSYIGSKRKLVDWIWQHTPEGVGSVLDAFSGSAVVAYMFKKQGLRVVANDRLTFSWHVARAIIENDSVTLSDDEIDALLQPNAKADDFVSRTFAGKYFRKGVHERIDQVRANIDKLKGFKKDIALFALGRTCMNAAGSFGHFGSTVVKGPEFAKSPVEFDETFRKTCIAINGLVFDNGKENRALNQDIADLLPGIKVDLAYFDPPYATEFSTTNYETAYHFIEGLMTKWKGKTIDTDSKMLKYEEIGEATITKENAEEFFGGFLESAKSIPYWMISYRDHAFPTEPQIKAIIEQQGKATRMFSHDHAYHLAGAKKGDSPSQAKERLFVCGPSEASLKTKADSPEDDLTAIAPDTTVGSLAAEAVKGKRVMVTAFMGSKTAMLEWIWKHTPDVVESVLDLFSGGSNVAYMYKMKGLRVVTNDLLQYPYHIARAVIENSSVTLSEEEMDDLMKPNGKAGDFIVRTFEGYYYTRPILEFLDSTWANIQELQGYKKDLALFALGRTCQIKAAFGEFARSKKTLTESISKSNDPKRYEHTSLGNIPLSEFTATFRKCLEDANSLVFDNGQSCKAYNTESLSLLPRVNVDLVYADPPYITQFGANDYESKMHFIEGLMTRWKGKEILDNGLHSYPSRTKYTKESIGELIQGVVEGSSRMKAHLLLSYRDKAFPTASELKTMMNDRYSNVDFRRKGVTYHLARWADEDGGKNAQEYLVIGSKPKAKASLDLPENGLIGRAFEVTDVHLTADAAADESSEPTFEFILAHVGTNKNGDVFLKDELKKAAATIIDKKINLQHDQYLGAVVGKVTNAQFEDTEGGRVKCTGVLFTQDVEAARAAYRLLKEGFIPVVSMECRMEAARCSYCQREASGEKDLCIHLKKYHNKEFKGKRVTREMVGITFTGVGLLEGTPADDRALITRVAQREGQHKAMKHKRFREVVASGISDSAKLSEAFASHMDDLLENQDDPDVKELVKQSTEDFTSMAGELLAEAAKKPFKDDLTKENEQLKKQVDDLTKQLDEIRKAEKAKAKAESAKEILDLMKKSGRSFADEIAEKAELDRLQSLSEETLNELKGSLTTLKAAAEIVDDTKGVTRTNGTHRPQLQPDEVPGGIGELRTTIRDGLKHSYARFKATDEEEGE